MRSRKGLNKGWLLTIHKLKLISRSLCKSYLLEGQGRGLYVVQVRGYTNNSCLFPLANPNSQIRVELHKLRHNILPIGIK